MPLPKWTAPGAGPPAAAARGSSRGIGGSSSPLAERVSDDLRRGSGDLLRRRRRVAALSAAAAGAMGAVALYQTGVVKHLPDPPLPGLDSDKVDAAGEAYVMFRTSDAALGVASYGATLALAAMGAGDRAREQPWIPLLLAAKVGADAAGAALLTLEQATKHRAFCFYCLLASAASLVMVPQVIPETKLAWRQLRGKKA